MVFSMANACMACRCSRGEMKNHVPAVPGQMVSLPIRKGVSVSLGCIDQWLKIGKPGFYTCQG